MPKGLDGHRLDRATRVSLVVYNAHAHIHLKEEHNFENIRAIDWMFVCQKNSSKFIC